MDLDCLSARSWTGACTRDYVVPPGPLEYEPPVILTAVNGEMKALLVLALVLLAGSSAFAYGATDVAKGVSSLAFALTEPAYMLLSGTLLILLAGAVRRLSI